MRADNSVVSNLKGAGRLGFGLCLLLMWAMPGALAHAAETGATLTLFDRATIPYVTYDSAGGKPIAKVSGLLVHDLAALSGRTPAMGADFKGASGSGVIIGRMDSPRMAALLRDNHIDTAAVKGKWETYGRAVIPAPWDKRQKALVIFGSDTRGTIWGVIDLTREMGVSPWEWWADVKVRAVDHIAVSAATVYSQPPAVQYRGFFLNAGDHGLNPWSAKTFDTTTSNMGPKTYDRIFELMWRLKANLIWPAMTNADVPFDGHPKNARLADDYAIVHGTSHVEMLMRNNPHEWDKAKYGAYNWLTNSQKMIDYWRGGVDRDAKYENIYTVGLRNIDDFPMQGADTPQQMASILGDAITQQRKILTEELHKPAAQIPQVFTLYKEVLPAYDTGLLKIPDDITLMWAEDDFGYVRRLSNSQERLRSGGSGIYYHNVFWGPPMSYLWLDASDPSLMWEEMTKSARFDARKEWMLNVGSIKPCEFMTELFLAMAFDPDRFKDGASVEAFLKTWVTQSFGADDADEITHILWRYYKLAFDRNPEFMAWTEVFPETPVQQTQFNMLDFGDENARRADEYRQLMADARRLMDKMPADRKDAFFQLVQYPVDASADINIRQLDLDKSITYGLQHRASADLYAKDAQRAQDQIATDAHYYNDVMSGGKWRFMMDTFPHDLPVFEAPHLPTWSTAGDTKCGVQTEGGAYFDDTGWWTPTLPQYHPELRETRYIDVFEQGKVATHWTATPDVPWIQVTKTAGDFAPGRDALEDRIEVSIDWSKAPAGGKGTITVQCGTSPQPIGVHVELAAANTVGNVSFIENSKIVSIYATHADQLSGGWETLDGLGHVGADLRSKLDVPTLTRTDDAAIAAAPKAVYRFATTTADDKATLRVIALPMFPLTSENQMRVAVSIDGDKPVILDLYAPEFSNAWRQHALSNTTIEILPNLRLKPGAHALTVYALDPGVTLDRFEIAFTGAPVAYDPVPETRIVTR